MVKSKRRMRSSIKDERELERMKSFVILVEMPQKESGVSRILRGIPSPQMARGGGKII